jgi:hypothetical protein
MAKSFYTERDIEELAARGVKSLEVDDDVVLTELAVEKAERLGVKLVRADLQRGDVPRPGAPVRPYIASAVESRPAKDAAAPQSRDDLHQRVRAAVIARLGSQLDPALLDRIIQRVLDNVGGK